MNSFYKCEEPNPHLHIHVRPRYKNALNINDNAYNDEEFGRHYKLKKEIQLIETDRVSLFELMKGKLNAGEEKMKIQCVWEHNENDSLLYAANYIGAFTRGTSKEIAISKMQKEIEAYLRWKTEEVPGLEAFEIEIIQEKASELHICDADSDVLFEQEKGELLLEEYLELKSLVLKSAKDFLELYEKIPQKEESCLPMRKTFYGQVPRTAREMYEHTKSVNSYYFGEIGVEADSDGTIYECRKRGFELLEKQPDFLKNTVFLGSYDEEWSLRKVFRRFIWHDRIHAKAMYRMAVRTFGEGAVPDVFGFESV